MLAIKKIVISQQDINDFIPKTYDVSVKEQFNSVILMKAINKALPSFPSLYIDYWSVEEDNILPDKKFILTIAVKLLSSTN